MLFSIIAIQLGMAIAPLVLPYVAPAVENIPRMVWPYSSTEVSHLSLTICKAHYCSWYLHSVCHSYNFHSQKAKDFSLPNICTGEGPVLGGCQRSLQIFSILDGCNLRISHGRNGVLDLCASY